MLVGNRNAVFVWIQYGFIGLNIKREHEERKILENIRNHMHFPQ
jgi:hypothetical protein